MNKEFNTEEKFYRELDQRFEREGWIELGVLPRKGFRELEGLEKSVLAALMIGPFDYRIVRGLTLKDINLVYVRRDEVEAVREFVDRVVQATGYSQGEETKTTLKYVN